MIIALCCPFCPPYKEGEKYKGIVKDPKHPGRDICGDCGHEQPFVPYKKTILSREFPSALVDVDLIPNGALDGAKIRPGKWEVEVRFYPTVEAYRTDENGEPTGLNQSLEVTCFACQKTYTVRAICPEAPGGARYSSDKDFCKYCGESNIDVRPTGYPPPCPVEETTVTTTPPDGKVKFVKGAGPKGKLPR